MISEVKISKNRIIYRFIFKIINSEKKLNMDFNIKVDQQKWIYAKYIDKKLSNKTDKKFKYKLKVIFFCMTQIIFRYSNINN